MKTTKCVALSRGQKNTAVILVCLLIVAAVGWSASAPAGGKNDLAISLLAQKVIAQPDGKEKLQPAERAFPGEIIQYNALYHNQSDQPVRQVEPTLPIPAGMVYVPNSAKPAPQKASLDGKNFESIPLQRRVTMPNGQVQLREVPATEYRALRWSVGDMAPGTKTTVVARTRLVPVNTQAAP